MDIEIPVTSPVPVAMEALSEIVDHALDLIGVKDSWLITRGAGIKIGIIDTGVYPHLDLDGALQYLEAPGDPFGHGTHVAGLMGARANDIGIRGVAPECRIVVVGGVPGPWSIVAEKLDALRLANCDVINMSFGSGTPPPQEVLDAIERCHIAGIVLVASAGNTKIHGIDTIDYPARCPNVIPVAAIDDSGAGAPFSSEGSPLDVGYAMPGVNLYSTWNDGGYAYDSGTSMAAPLLSGIIALMLAKHRIDQGGSPIPTSGPVRIQAVLDHLDAMAHAVGDPAIFGKGYIDASKL